MVAFAKAKEGVWKDVEREFGVLTSRFRIIISPAGDIRLHRISKIKNVVLSCIIIQNMVVKARQDNFDMNRRSVLQNVGPVYTP